MDPNNAIERMQVVVNAPYDRTIYGIVEDYNAKSYNDLKERIRHEIQLCQRSLLSAGTKSIEIETNEGVVIIPSQVVVRSVFLVRIICDVL
jgi:hypothetical protein